MSKSFGFMVLSVALGATLMYGASNFRVRVEPVAAEVPTTRPSPFAEAAPLPQPPEPARLPASVVRTEGAFVPPVHAGHIQLVQAPAANPLKVLSVTEQVTVAGVKTPVNWPLAPPPPLMTRGTITVKFDKSLDEKDSLLIAGVVAPAVTDLADKTKLLLDFGTAELSGFKGQVNIKVLDPGKVVRTSFDLRVPTTTPDRVIVGQYFNSPYTDAAPVPTGPERVPLFGSAAGSYLRLAGQKLNGGGTLAFVAQIGDADKVFAVDAVAVGPQQTSAWQYQLRSLSLLTADILGFVAVRAEHAGEHTYATATVPFKAEAVVATQLAAPAVAVEKGTAAAAEKVVAPDGKNPALVRSNTSKLKVTVTTTDANARAILLYVDNNPVPLSAATAGAGTQVFDNVEVGPGRDHALRAAVARGEVVGSFAVTEVKVMTTGPGVRSVAAPGFGSGGGKETISVQFAGEDLDPATVVAANFVLSFTTNSGSTPIDLLDAPKYDAVTKIVTLTYASKHVAAGAYRLKIKTNAGTLGVKDVFGNYLVGATGAEPSDLDVDLTAAVGDKALPSVVATGLSLQTAPSVPLPEYVQYRKSPDGFNPSDRVETRVVRLYYYRDAGRVAQLVNRTVKAYNATRADVRRLAADRARDDANSTTDERKRLEGVAVRAAQETRAAENELRQLQEKGTTARTESATARTAISQKQIELDQARRDLAAARTQVDARSATDAGVLNQMELLRTLRETQTQILEVLKTNENPADRLRQRENDARIQTEELNLTRIKLEAQARAAGGIDPLQNRVLELERQVSQYTTVAGSAEATDRNTASALVAAQNKVADLREKEARTLESWKVKEWQELRGRENEFRRDVAAANENLDIAAAAQPLSEDPVLQTSIAVIGEGLIQLRGPIKGLNVIRTMINQIDAPVGQVRIGVHTLQVNGERVDRMEKVVANIQRHIDHSRFLTVQSGEYLRKAVVLVASRKAEQAAAELGPDCTQAARDYKYLYAFFGKDFTDELYLLDSEFLKTGNKLLSLHSMNTTSLASALFVMALAKNDVRAEIGAEFQRMVQCDLPQAEWNYYLAGLVPGNKCEAHCDKKFYMLSHNARFQSFLGFFNAEVHGSDTMNPLQREFLRLAQIFKARMITEIQLKQRVMERSLLEDRVGNYLKELNDAKTKEDDAKKQLELALKSKEESKAVLGTVLTSLFAEAAEIQLVAEELRILFEEQPDLIEKKVQSRLAAGEKVATGDKIQPHLAGFSLSIESQRGPREIDSPPNLASADPADRVLKFTKNWDDIFRRFKQVKAKLDLFVFIERQSDKDEFDRLIRKLTEGGEVTLGELKRLSALGKSLYEAVLAQIVTSKHVVLQLTTDLGRTEVEFQTVARTFVEFQKDSIARLGGPLKDKAVRAFARVEGPMSAALNAEFQARAARQLAQRTRRPLDEKKLLDILVDEMEDKFIELLEGTRAHTANVDNYMKNVATALDDDFNTQFYLPSFRRAREASTKYWDVTLAQIETTNVLANNRAFAKVSPAASFEFDLPKRSILLKEGFASAKALMDEYGALVTDPSFLALAKISSGNPVSMMSGGGGGLSAVRSVLPGLPSSSDEMIMAQAGGGRGKEVGSALEALIPDPAIYKIETGTGFEIRPVLSPDGQAVVFNFNYMYTTDVREPVRADEKHLGRVKRHFVNTEVHLGNYELREVSKYQVATKLARTAKGVPLLQDIPGLGLLFRPLPSAGSALQQNLIYAQSTIFPTLFDLMGLRYAQAVADLDPMADRLAEFSARNRRLDVEQRLYDLGAARVDEALRIPFGERRPDLYRPMVTIPYKHPNGYYGPALRQRDGVLQETFDPAAAYPPTPFSPGTTEEGRQRALPGFGPAPPPGGGLVPEMYNGAIPFGVNEQGRRNLPPSSGVAPQFGGIAGPNGYSPPPDRPGATAVREMPATKYPPTVTPGGVPATPVSRPALPRPPAPSVPAMTPPPGAGAVSAYPR